MVATVKAKPADTAAPADPVGVHRTSYAESSNHQFMTVLKALNILSAICSAVGTIALFNGSYAYESMPYMDDADFSITKSIGKRNRSRQTIQRLGLVLILLGLALQVLAVVMEP
jgi:hypothetical protein